LTVTHNPIYLALDITDFFTALELVEAVRPYIGGIKIGPPFLLENGLEACREISEGFDLFLDLKFHDIPTTVQASVTAAARALQPTFLTVHCGAGTDYEMLLAARASTILLPMPPRLLGVTRLTSLPANLESVNDYADNAYHAGFAGVVCASQEVDFFRQMFGPNFILMVPGIRETTETHDQKRTGTALATMQAGANFLVIGRAIHAAPDPVLAAKTIFGTLKDHGYA
jgi:orotidine-5'-phosphate decarboxylase